MSDRWMTFDHLSQSTGLSVRELMDWKVRGNWIEGVHFKPRPEREGDFLADLDAIYAWIDAMESIDPKTVKTPTESLPSRRRGIDMEERTCLYRHFDADGRLLYIGISVNVKRRLGRHLDTSHWSDAITRVEIQRFSTRTEALDAERNAIASERPLHNIIYARAPEAP